MTQIIGVCPKPPTTDPEFHEGRHPHINVFALRPINPDLLNRFDTLNINLSTYVDPFGDNDLRKTQQNHQSWVQGMTLDIAEIGLARYETTGYKIRQERENNWGDRVFRGQITGHDSGLEVVGVMHPQQPGWLAFVGEIDLASPESPTIADLKALIGKITTEQALEANIHYRETGTFAVHDQFLS